MNQKQTRATLFAVLAAALITPAAWADPCGMVPPIYTGKTSPIARIGDQQTYVFFKEGVETFVIRPGFTGNVDEFGMLIPFPSPPALRKAPDHIFEHIQAAIDPPEVMVYLHRFGDIENQSFERNSRRELKNNSGGLAVNEVKVIRQEAVGMYEVAVLEAGSSAALKRWMDDHGYQFPVGMDAVCDDYVKDRWCFVAIKTKVGKKADADPQPGQRAIRTGLPNGATFDGAVQAMAFRFPTDELVVPMRLSAFNGGDMHNIIYLLTDSPRRVRFVPEEYVVRQVNGEQLLANMTEPLPLRVIGGTFADIPKSYFTPSLKAQRNPYPRSGAALDLFSSDLLAVQSKQLALPHEETEKRLLAIGERLGLRGGEIDAIHHRSLAEMQKQANEKGAADLKGMTLTIIDGDLPRELIANRNLTFADYRMPQKRNKTEYYNAREKGPQSSQPGVRVTGSLDELQSLHQAESQIAVWPRTFGALIGLTMICFGCGFALRSNRLPKSKHRSGGSSGNA